jgi:alkyldihydroxyacetonephosphate synthase
MPDVKHMKWSRWGVEGVSFHHENKPAFRPFVINAIDLDVNAPPTAPVLPRMRPGRSSRLILVG